MQFEWDESKATQNIAQNIAKHGVAFDYAARIFLDPRRITVDDTRAAYGEHRQITIGEIECRVFIVAHTTRAKRIRIISARKGNSREQKKYHAFYA